MSKRTYCYNHEKYVISCPNCRRIVMLEGVTAKVARLEAAIAAKDAALRDMVAIASERLVQFPADGYFRQLYDIGGAALSDAGKGWVPVNLVWAYLWHRATCAVNLRSESCDCAFDEVMERAKKAKASLDALKGVE